MEELHLSNSLGKHLIVDCYGCYEEVLSNPTIITDALASAMVEGEQPIDHINCLELQDEIIISYFAEGCHVCIHSYPSTGYAAVDIYTFRSPLKDALVMKALKEAFGAERIKSTSVNRGDFGSIADMKPRHKTTFTAKGQVIRTGKSLKKTGSTIKKTGVKVFRVIARKKVKPSDGENQKG